jgi:hypothetical protein
LPHARRRSRRWHRLLQILCAHEFTPPIRIETAESLFEDRVRRAVRPACEAIHIRIPGEMDAPKAPVHSSSDPQKGLPQQLAGHIPPGSEGAFARPRLDRRAGMRRRH